MIPEVRWSVEAPWGAESLCIYEPTLAEVLAAAPSLVAFYNDRHNSTMMTNTQDLTAADVVETFESFWAAGDHPFLLEWNGELMGDADFRHGEGAAAEFAILVGPRAQQSRGLGTRFAAMMHVAARRAFKFERIYATIIPANIASRRMLEKLGYQLDQSQHAASFSEADDDIAMSLDLAEFERTHADLFKEAIITERAPSTG